MQEISSPMKSLLPTFTFWPESFMTGLKKSAWRCWRGSMRPANQVSSGVQVHLVGGILIWFMCHAHEMHIHHLTLYCQCLCKYLHWRWICCFPFSESQRKLLSLNQVKGSIYIYTSITNKKCFYLENIRVGFFTLFTGRRQENRFCVLPCIFFRMTFFDMLLKYPPERCWIQK